MLSSHTNHEQVINYLLERIKVLSLENALLYSKNQELMTQLQVKYDNEETTI